MTTTTHDTDLRYPVGKFSFDSPISEAEYPKLIAAIAETPGALRAAVAGLSRDQLETRYRPGGWTVKQVVHHVPDSHMNAYIRMKFAITEEAHDQGVRRSRWAELPDRRSPVEVSLVCSTRCTALVDAAQIDDAATSARLRHPSTEGTHPRPMLWLYAGTGDPVAHITSPRKREGW